MNLAEAATQARTKELRHEGNHVTFLNLYIDICHSITVPNTQYIVAARN